MWVGVELEIGGKGIQGRCYYSGTGDKCLLAFYNVSNAKIGDGKKMCEFYGKSVLRYASVWFIS
jgi:hypothetical protein